MNEKLKEAINVVENAGGIVMMQESMEEHELLLRESAKIDQEIEKSKYKTEYEERKNDAFEELENALGKKNFSFQKAEDILYENGLDLDDMEEWLLSH